MIIDPDLGLYRGRQGWLRQKRVERMLVGAINDPPVAIA
jgi:hypothetical protein